MQRTFLVAELSANHGHDLAIALETVRAAKKAGADAIKLQTYTADTITLDCDNEYFQIRQGTRWDGTTLYKLYQEAHTPWEWHKPIKDEAGRLGMTFFSTPFDPTAVDFLEKLGVPMYKIASFEINDIPLIRLAASKGKPMILSTGVATLGEIEDAVAACRAAGNGRITLLKCTSEYPASPKDANLRTMVNLADTFGVDVGLSDHTEGIAVAIAAVALGAKIIEKHFILDRSIGGPDASFSMEPAAFTEMAGCIRDAEYALGSVDYEMTDEKSQSRHFMRSLFVVKDMDAGEAFNATNVRSIRPGDGLPPVYFQKLTECIAARRMKRGEPLVLSDIRNKGASS